MSALLDELWSDLTDRRGFRQQMETVDEEIQGEWKAKWEAIIKNHIAALEADRERLQGALAKLVDSMPIPDNSYQRMAKAEALLNLPAPPKEKP